MTSKINYSKDQKKAIYLEDKNIIVSAQAGAGKTQVLVERILTNLRGISYESGNLRIREEKQSDLDRMLIVTFTNKAAQEMKDRIRSSLATLISEDPEDQRFLIDQASKVNQAQISTMHSFCINSIRSYFQELGINPKFTILNEATLRILKWEAMDEAFDHLYELEDEGFHQFLFEYSDLKDDEAVKQMLLSLYNFLMSQIDPWAWLDKAISAYDIRDYAQMNELEIKDYEKKILSVIEEVDRDRLKEAKTYLDLLNDLNNNRPLLAGHIEVIEDDQALYERLIRLYDEGDLDTLNMTLKNHTYKRLPSYSKKLKESGIYDDQAIALFKEIRDNFKKAISGLAIAEDLNIDFLITLESNTRVYLDTIKKIIIDFDKRFKAKKKAKEGLDFNDTEYLMVELLKNPTVADELSQQFEYIYFDEYQDANQIQNHIVESIKSEDNLFFVGDIKQSIYRFRLADPSIFQSRYEKYKYGDDPIEVAVDLAENYRSREEILDFSNGVFKQLMTKSLGEIDYDDPAHLFNAAGKFEAIDKEKLIDIYFLDKESVDKDLEESLDYQDLELSEESNQAYFIAKKIAQAIEEGARPKDFGILLRNKAMIPLIGDYLQAFNIPFYTDSIDFDYNHLEVREFIEILKAIDNDKNDLVLLSAASSVIGDLSEDDLAIIRASLSELPFYQAFYNYDNEDDIKAKIEIYKSRTKLYRDLEKTMSLYDFAWYVLIDSGFMTYVLSKFNGKDKLDNVVAFIEEIKDYEENASPGLFQFLNHVDRMQTRGISELEPGASLSEEDDVVRMMTIHKAKGLQMPYVIIANLDRRFNKRDLSNRILYHNHLGIALKHYDPETDKHVNNIFFDKLAYRVESELLSEEVRLQYVAMTRAINQLMLVGEIDLNFFNKLPQSLNKASSPLAWLATTVLADPKARDFRENQQLEILENDRSYFEKNSVNISRISYEDILNEKIAFVRGEETKDQKIFERLSIDAGFFDYKYPHMADSLHPLKKTVSELASHNDSKPDDYKAYEVMGWTDLEEDSFKVPKFMQDEASLTAAEVGTITHRILQLLKPRPYDDESLEEMLNQLIVEEKLSQEEKDLLDRQAVLSFYQSPIGQRLLKADKLYQEEAFTMMHNDHGFDILVDGQIDLFFKEADSLVLIDYKTGNPRYASNYEKQFALYIEGLEKATPYKVKEAYIYWTRTKAFSSFDLDKQTFN